MWEKIYFNSQNIERETNKGVIIKMPRKSNYAGYLFWHPLKLVKDEGGKGYYKSLVFNQNWEFKLKKNKTEVKLKADEMRMQFDKTIQNIISHSMDSYLTITDPKPIDAKVEVDESLKR